MEKIKFPFLAINGFDNGRDVSIVYRNYAGTKSVRKYKNYPWYFAIDGKYYERAKKLESFDGIKVEMSGVYAKIYCPRDFNNEDFRKDLRKKLEDADVVPYEMDCSLTKRFMLDNEIEIEEKLKIGFVDIETDDSVGGISVGRDRIISFAICDQTGKVSFHYDANESLLLEKFVEEAKEYDVLCGWNSEEFDFPYLKLRLEMHDISFEWKRMLLFDFMKRFIKLFGPAMVSLGLPGFSLEEVSQTFLQKGKVKHKEKIFELERDNLELLKEYNAMDVRLLYELDEKLKLFDLIIKECTLTGTFLNRFYVGELLDNYILREAHKQGKYLPTQPEKTDEVKKIHGAFVLDPVIGLHEKVRIFDFKSMYPSIILSFNISHDTLSEKTSNTIFSVDEKGNAFVSEEAAEKSVKEDPTDNIEGHTRVPSGYYFSLEKGIYSDLARRLLEMRKGYKKMQNDAEYGSVEYNNARAMQEVVKELANSMYGITADPSSRFFDKRIAESITLTGQYVLRMTKYFFEEVGYKVLYQDTDSLFVCIPEQEKIAPVLAEVNRKLEKHLRTKHNITGEYIIELQYEKTFDPLLLVEKKHYCGLMTDMDGKPVNKLFTRGLENVKKDTIGYTRRRLNELLNAILVERKGMPYFTTWMADIKREVFESDITPEDLKITKKVSKPTSDYKNKPIHVKLAEEKIKKGEMLETRAGKHTWGQKVEYIVTNSNGTVIGKDQEARGGKKGMEAVNFEDFAGIWDRTYYWNVQIFNVMFRILNAAWPEYDWNQYQIKKLKRVKAEKKEKVVKTTNQQTLF